MAPQGGALDRRSTFRQGAMQDLNLQEHQHHTFVVPICMGCKFTNGRDKYDAVLSV